MTTSLRTLSPRRLLLALVLPMLVLAGMASLTRENTAAASSCEIVAGDTALNTVERELLDLINDYRAANGVGRLTVSGALNRAATWYAIDMAQNDYFAHTEPNGRTISNRIHDCGYPAGGWEGENLAGGNPLASAESVFEAWKNSPGHNENLLRAEFTTIGIAREQVDGSRYGHYWVTDFGSLGDVYAAGAPSGTAPAPTPEPRTTRFELQLTKGASQVEWEGANTPIAQVIAGIDLRVVVIYGWDHEAGRWARYAPGAESWVNSLKMFETGEVYWIYAY